MDKYVGHATASWMRCVYGFYVGIFHRVWYCILLIYTDTSVFQMKNFIVTVVIGRDLSTAFLVIRVNTVADFLQYGIFCSQSGHHGTRKDLRECEMEGFRVEVSCVCRCFHDGCCIGARCEGFCSCLWGVRRPASPANITFHYVAWRILWSVLLSVSDIM